MIPPPPGGGYAAYTSRCRTCGREIQPEAQSCPHCGAANLEERCPHCGAVTATSPDKEMRWRCDLCGGPRLPRADPTVRRSKRELVHLKRANDARKSRAKSRALGAAAGALGFGSTALMALWLLIFGLSLPVAVVWALFAGTSAAVVLWSLGRAKNAAKEMKIAIDQAWLAAAGDVAARMKGPFSSEKLAKALGVDETQAEELLALLEANDLVRSDITDAGELSYQTKFRVGSVDTGAGEVDVEAMAEAEALAEAEAMRAKANR
ncbi:MAG: zinc ribbon domain-containing protein [Polyangiaceae bacterium]